MNDRPTFNALSLPPLAEDILGQLGLTLLHDIVFDPASGKFSATMVEADGSNAQILLEVHAADRRRLADEAGNDRVKIELRMVSGPKANVALALLGHKDGTTWAYGAMIDLPTPAFALEKLVVRSRLSELGKQCAAVAHEIRQPLFTIAMAGENLRLALAAYPDLAPRTIPALDHIEEEVERARTIVDQTLNYAAGRPGSNGPADSGVETSPMRASLERAAAHAARLLAYGSEKADIKLDTSAIVGPARVPMPQIELEQVLLNVMRNAKESIRARKATGWTGQGLIALTLDIKERHLVCTISDNGEGLLSAEPDARIQPFVTSKGKDGNGLGLYICEQLLARAGGYLKLLPGETEGAKVEITLPLCAPKGIEPKA